MSSPIQDPVPAQTVAPVAAVPVPVAPGAKTVVATPVVATQGAWGQDFSAIQPVVQWGRDWYDAGGASAAVAHIAGVVLIPLASVANAFAHLVLGAGKFVGFTFNAVLWIVGGLGTYVSMREEFALSEVASHLGKTLASVAFIGLGAITNLISPPSAHDLSRALNLAPEAPVVVPPPKVGWEKYLEKMPSGWGPKALWEKGKQTSLFVWEKGWTNKTNKQLAAEGTSILAGIYAVSLIYGWWKGQGFDFTNSAWRTGSILVSPVTLPYAGLGWAWSKMPAVSSTPGSLIESAQANVNKAGDKLAADILSEKASGEPLVKAEADAIKALSDGNCYESSWSYVPNWVGTRLPYMWQVKQDPTCQVLNAKKELVQRAADQYRANLMALQAQQAAVNVLKPQVQHAVNVFSK